jgi:hypothetical protein
MAWVPPKREVKYVMPELLLASQGFRHGIVTLNEAREMLDLPPNPYSGQNPLKPMRAKCGNCGAPQQVGKCEYCGVVGS